MSGAFEIELLVSYVQNHVRYQGMEYSESFPSPWNTTSISFICRSIEEIL
jgi:hypothetical protein